MNLPRISLLLAAAVLTGSCAADGSVARQSAIQAAPENEAQVETAASGAPEAARAASDAGVPLGRLFTLGVGATAHVDDELEVTFESVVEDSRCPLGVDCIWEGNAEIAIQVAKAGEPPASRRLNTHPSRGTEVSYLGYRIGLIDLEPYPRADTGAQEPYRATLVVDTAEEQQAPPE